ncbi:MAG TPA: glycosyltransferase 87 family protein, partial [Saprospiraceae bacterium]|nr:glycosyltransferase 87 family protein [Saprospiraceae bacterium]
PDAIGLTLWNLLNALVLAWAILSLPKMSERQKSLVLLVAAIEAMTSMQNEQSNALIAGLLIFAFVFCEKEKYFFAIGCILLASFIKPFGLAGFALFLFYPEKLKNMGKALLWAGVLFALPLVAIHGKELILQYQAWLGVLAKDQAHEYGYSVAGWLHTWFHFEPNKNLLTGMGMALFMIPFLRIKLFSVFEFRLLALSSLLVWIVIFNHMAESPTFIIALTGAGIWYFSKENPTTVDTLLFLLAFAFASLSTTDIVPHHIRRDLFRPYVIKAVPMIWLWSKILLDMLRFGKSAGNTSIPQPA